MDDLPHETHPHPHATMDRNRYLPQSTDRSRSHPPTQYTKVRTANRRDLPFIDSLQKTYSNNVGFLPGPALIAYVDRLSILIAEDASTQVGYLLARPALAWQPLLRPIFQLCITPDAQRNHHAAALLTAWQNLAKLSNQIALQANCAADIGAHTFWPAQGFKFICQLATKNKRRRDIIVWRKPITSQIPRWLIDAPARAGHQAKKQGAIL